MTAHLTHTAVLVHSVDRVAEFFAKRNFHINPSDTFEGEGTREIYIGDFEKHSSLILLIEPHGPGAYERALKKRGAGLHHIGIDVEDLVAYCTRMGRLGWLLHAHSLCSVPKLKTAYLVRPGVPLMLEVHERSGKSKLPPLLKGIRLPGATEHLAMLEGIGLSNASIEVPKAREVIFETAKCGFSLSELLRFDRKAGKR